MNIFLKEIHQSTKKANIKKLLITGPFQLSANITNFLKLMNV